ncbi:hypothetical protein GWN42_30885, partial [candidate division KSB1 bacterium]|nr:hypothetical protein [candidate division KSB1 bacterium]
EALIRWQELAEVTEEKAAGLEDELAALSLQLKESNQVVEMVRAQRDKLETEWEKTNRELMEMAQEKALLQADLNNKTQQLSALEVEREQLQGSFNALQRRIETQPPEYEQLAEKMELVSANNADLKTRLKQAEKEAQDYHEQWLWTKASLDTTSSELDLLRETADKYDDQIKQLQDKIAEQERTVENWKNSVGRMTNLLYEAEAKAKELEKIAEAARKEAADSEEKEILQGQIRM